MADTAESLAEALRVAVANHASRAEAAEQLAALARDGEDIEAAVPALEEALDHATQVGILNPAADALALHFLRLDQVDRLVELAGRARWGDYLWKALGRAADGGVPLGALLRCLQGDSGMSQRDRRGVVEKWVEKHPARLAEVAARLREQDPELLLAIMWDFSIGIATRVDPAPLLEHLRGILESASGKLLEDAVTRTWQAANKRLDVTALRPALEALARRRAPGVAEKALFALVMAAANDRDWGEVDRRLATRSPARREVAYRALCMLSRREEAPNPELLRRLVAGLGERDPQIHEPILELLRKDLAAGKDVRAPDAVLGRLGRRASDHPAYAGIQEYLFAVGVQEAEAPCPTCLILGLRTEWSIRDSVPAVLTQLDDEGDFRYCKGCQAAYRYTRQEDDRGLYLEWHDTLQRLSPRRAAAEVPEPRQADAARLLEDRQARARRDLHHPLEQLRVEGAWALAEDAVLAGDVDALDALASHRDPVVVRAALKAVNGRHDRDDCALPSDEVLRGVLPRGGNRDEDETSQLATRLLTRRGLRAAEHEQVLARLADPDLGRLRAALQVLHRMARSGFDLGPYVSRLGELSSHTDGGVRRSAGWALEHAPATEDLNQVRLERALQHLRGDDPELWEDGAEALADLGSAGVDVGAHLELLVPGFADPDRAYRAHKALAALLRADVGADALLPNFFAALRARPAKKMGCFETVLYTMRDLDLHRPEFLEDLIRALRDRRSSVPDNAFELLELASDAHGEDLAPYRARLLKTAPGLQGYMTERIGKMAGRLDRAAGDLESLATLLEHKNSDLRYGAMMAIEEGAGAGERLAPLIEPLVRQLGDRSRVHRQQAARHLQKIVGKRGKDRARLAKALESAAECPEAEELRAWLGD